MCYSGICPREDQNGNCLKGYSGFSYCPIVIGTLANEVDKLYTVVIGTVGDWDHKFSKVFDNKTEAQEYEDALKVMYKLNPDMV